MRPIYSPIIPRENKIHPPINNCVAIMELYPTAISGTNNLLITTNDAKNNPRTANNNPIIVVILKGFTENAVNPFNHKERDFFNVKPDVPPCRSRY